MIKLIIRSLFSIKSIGFLNNAFMQFFIVASFEWLTAFFIKIAKQLIFCN